MKTKRKIIQITADSEAPIPGASSGWITITALCNDGTVWDLDYDHTKNPSVRRWTKLPPIPES